MRRIKNNITGGYTIVILGVTGDLSRKKLLPACYQLFKKEKIIILGAALDKTDASAILAQADQYIHHKDEDIWVDFNAHFFYQQLDFNKLSDYTKLSQEVERLEKQFGFSGNRLIYLAASAEFYCAITKNLTQSGIVKRESGQQEQLFYRVVYEKPFGWDLDSARQINQCIAKNLNEEQVYRVDHYLTKSLVNSIALIRFANILFEPVWNRDYIDHVQILFSETGSVVGRSLFYDKYGALKDVVQNHMLQLLSLICMEKPHELEAHQVSAVKTDVLKNTSVTDGLLAQYEGYELTEHVAEKSKTETFALLRLSVDTDRWRDVPFYLKTGKNLDFKSTEISIVFKSISREFFGTSGLFDPNILTIRISPNSGFSLQLNTQKGGALNKVTPVKMDFCYKCLFGEFPHSYEILITEILKGERSIAVCSKEIEYAWRIIDQAKSMQLPLYYYEPGTRGPFELEKFNKKYHIRWVR